MYSINICILSIIIQKTTNFILGILNELIQLEAEVTRLALQASKSYRMVRIKKLNEIQNYFTSFKYLNCDIFDNLERPSIYYFNEFSYL